MKVLFIIIQGINLLSDNETFIQGNIKSDLWNNVNHAKNMYNIYWVKSQSLSQIWKFGVSSKLVSDEITTSGADSVSSGFTTAKNSRTCSAELAAICFQLQHKFVPN